LLADDCFDINCFAYANHNYTIVYEDLIVYSCTESQVFASQLVTPCTEASVKAQLLVHKESLKFFSPWQGLLSGLPNACCPAHASQQDNA